MGNHKVLKTAGGNSHYSMYEFIDAIKELRILWDRQHVDFNSRELRDKAWHSVGRKLCKNYDKASEEEQNEIAKTLLKRWKNTRDSFFRVSRLRYVEQDRFRPSYIYEKELAFLVEGNKELEMMAAFSSAAPSRRGSKNQSLPIEKHNHESAALSLSNIKDSARSASRQHLNMEKTMSTRSSTAATATAASPPKSLAKPPTKNALRGNVYANEPKTTKAIKKRRLSEKSDRDSNSPDNENSRTETKFNEHEDIATASSNHSHEEGLLEMRGTVNETTLDDPGLGGTKQSKRFESAPVEQSSATNSGPNASFASTDPDQAFFDSIKPHMQQMSKDQKLEFQIEVLKLLRNS